MWKHWAARPGGTCRTRVCRRRVHGPVSVESRRQKLAPWFNVLSRDCARVIAWRERTGNENTRAILFVGQRTDGSAPLACWKVHRWHDKEVHRWHTGKCTTGVWDVHHWHQEVHGWHWGVHQALLHQFLHLTWPPFSIKSWWWLNDDCDTVYEDWSQSVKEVL